MYHKFYCFVTAVMLFGIMVFTASVSEAAQVKLGLIEGIVQIQRQGTTEWIGARTSTSLDTGDQIKTAGASFAEIIFQKGNNIYLKENSHFTIDGLEIKGRRLKTLRATLHVGEMMSRIKRIWKEESYQIRTPSAIVGVRGTVYYLKVYQGSSGDVLMQERTPFGLSYVYAQEGGDYITELFVEEGKVSFSNLLETISRMVGAGQWAAAFADGTVREPEDLPDEKKGEWQRGYDKKKSKDRKSREDADDKDLIRDAVEDMMDEAELLKKDTQFDVMDDRQSTDRPKQGH